MKRSNQLHVHEEALLLALRNDRGTVAGGTMFGHAAGGAILADLILSGHVRPVKDGRATYAVLEKRTSTDDDILNECITRMAEAKRRGKLVSWVVKFAGIRRLKHRVAARLVDKGVLRASEDKVLLIFTRRIYPELDSKYEEEVIARLHDAIFSDSSTVAPRTTVLVAVAHHSGLLKANFDRKELKARKARIGTIIKGDLVGDATKAAIDAAHAAMMAATVIPAAIAASSAG